MTRITPREWILLAVGVALAACVMWGNGACAAEFGSPTDYYGNRYPADCPDSIVETLSAQAKGRLIVIEAATPGAYGETSRWLGNTVLVKLRPGLIGWMKRDIRRHEFCHAKRLLENDADTGDWHAHYQPNVYRPPVCADPFHC